MALQYGYFDSTIIGYDEEGMPIFDRAQTSDFMAKFFSSLISSGVLGSPADSFQVTSYDGMKVRRKPGGGFLKGRFAWDDDDEFFTLEEAPSSVSYKRIDMIILRNNYIERKCEFIYRPGTAASNPQEPTFQRPESGDYYEVCVAKIIVPGGKKEITQSDIIDTRYDANYCGAVVQLINGLNAGPLLMQMEAQFNEWFDSVKQQLTEDAAGNLQMQINNLKDSISYGTELPETGKDGDIFILIEP